MIRTSVLAAVIVCVAFATPAEAGKVYLSGQDSDDPGHVATSFGGQILDFIGMGNTNSGLGILILGGDPMGVSRGQINVWNGVANSGAGYTLTQLNTSTLSGSKSADHPHVRAAIEAEQLVRQQLYDELAIAIRGLRAEIEVDASWVTTKP